MLWDSRHLLGKSEIGSAVDLLNGYWTLEITYMKCKINFLAFDFVLTWRFIISLFNNIITAEWWTIPIWMHAFSVKWIAGRFYSSRKRNEDEDVTSASNSLGNCLCLTSITWNMHFRPVFWIVRERFVKWDYDMVSNKIWTIQTNGGLTYIIPTKVIYVREKHGQRQYLLFSCLQLRVYKQVF